MLSFRVGGGVVSGTAHDRLGYPLIKLFVVMVGHINELFIHTLLLSQTLLPLICLTIVVGVFFEDGVYTADQV